MSSFKKKIRALKDLAYVTGGDVLSRAISSIFWLSIISFMTVKDYGLIHYYVGLASLGQLFSLIGTSSVITVYVSKNIKIQSTLFLISLIIGSIASLILFYFLQRIDVALLVILLIMCDLVGGVLLGKKKYSFYFRINLLQKILLLTFGLILFKFIGIDGILLGIIISYTIFIPIFYKQLKESTIDLSLLKNRKNFIMSNYTNTIISGLRRDVDKLIIPSMLGFIVLGNYSLGIQIYTLLMVFSQSFSKYTLPHDASGNQNKKLKKLMILTSVIIVTIAIILLPLVIPIWMPQFLENMQTFQIMIVSIIPTTISMLHISRFLGLEKSNFVQAMTITQISTLVAGFILLGNHFGLNGLAISFVLSSASSCSLAIYLNRRIKEK